MEKTNLNSIHFIERSKEFTLIDTYFKKNFASRVFVLVDENTKQYCLPIVQKNLTHKLTPIQIHSGETHKNLETCQFLWQELIDKGCDRNSILLNLGGGVITDMGGFVAATFKRGIRFINIPTSLLAMVDAAIGGKTGIDFKQLKNQIGLFANPEMTLIYPEFLKTLAPREIRSGLAEVIKYGLIKDSSIWEYIKNMDTTSFDIAPSIIKKSIAIKETIVKKDPTEKGERKTLNFGHTLGHAIETHFLSKSESEQLLHGEAVAVGMILAAHLSTKSNSFPLAQTMEIAKVIDRLFPKIIIASDDISVILKFLQHDKKNTNGKVNFVLLKEIGKPELDCQVTDNQLLEAFAFYNSL